MKTSAKALVCITAGTVCILLIVAMSPLFMNSKIERLYEENLPRVTIKNETHVYCRMQADDFTFPLPKNSVASETQISSSSADTIEGSLIVSFPNTDPISARTYQDSVQADLQTGGMVRVTKEENSSSLKVHFSYFGDR